MSGIYNHRQMVPGRTSGIPEWLDLIRQEFDTLSHEAMVVKAQRDECEHKINNQLQEMEAFRRALYELERKHESMKSQYHMWEEEVVRLRREVEQRGGVVQMPHQMAHNQPPPPNLGHSQSNLFGGIISGGPGGPGLVAPPQMADHNQQQQAQQQQQQQQAQQQQQQQQQAQQQQAQQQAQQQQHQAQQQHIQQQQQHHPNMQQPPQQHPYGGPMGPNGPQGPGPHSPYMNGNNNGPQQGQPQPKRFKTEGDGVRFKSENEGPPPGAPGSMYGNMSPNPHNNPNGQAPGSYNSPVPPPSSGKQMPKTNKSTGYAPSRDDAGSQSGSAVNKRKSGATSSTPTTVARTAGRGGNTPSANWSDDPDNVPAQLKREGPD
ncbi:general transcription repressor, partial [Podila epigama]